MLCVTVSMSLLCSHINVILLIKDHEGEMRGFPLRDRNDEEHIIAEGQNPHVVGLLGCVTIREPLCLITEFIKYGDLPI